MRSRTHLVLTAVDAACVGHRLIVCSTTFAWRDDEPVGDASERKLEQKWTRADAAESLAWRRMLAPADEREAFDRLMSEAAVVHVPPGPLNKREWIDLEGHDLLDSFQKVSRHAVFW
jgi:hypothetical protein